MESLYAAMLIAHSYLRWLVLALALWVSLQSFMAWRRARRWKALQERVHALFSGVLRVQFLLGLSLYLFLSPLSGAFFSNPATAIKVSEFRFFGLEHALMMLVAVAVAESGRARSKKLSDARRRQRVVFSSTSIALLLMLAAVPWPFMPIHRPLFRTTKASNATYPASDDCPPSYTERCASCHGESGRGDGVLAATLPIRPRSFADVAWNPTNERLRNIVREGGAVHGLSPVMPAHPDLSSQELDALLRCLRSFR